MNITIFIFTLLVSFFATILRFYVENNFIISMVGSFCFGCIIAKRFKKSINLILLSGFCSCFTSFSGFVYALYQMLSQENFFKIFLYLNLILISNLFMMYFGFSMTRKIT